MNAKVTKEIQLICNDEIYHVGDKIQVTEIEGFKHYARYFSYQGENTIDWIPKDSVEIIKV
jgi:hypothetical protein